MRIVAGEHRSVPLFTPEDDAIRPTSDKTRQAIFNKLGDVEDAIVLDGTAGTGAMGLEALSRGAAFVHFVEPDTAARKLVQKNIDKLKIGKDRYALHGNRLEAIGDAPHPMHIVFLDPPYGQNLLPVMVRRLIDKNWADKNTIFVMEESSKEIVALPMLEIADRKIYGAAQIIYARMPQ